MSAAEISAAAPSTLAGRQTGRLRESARRERKAGLLLALRLRLAVMVFVALYLLSLGLAWDQFINMAALVGLSLTAWLQYRIAGTRFDRPVVMGVFPVLDALGVAFAVFAGIEMQGIPRVILEEDRPFSWFVLLLTIQALAYRPWLAAWSGAVTAAVWIGALVWMLAYPGASAWLDIDALPTEQGAIQALIRAYYDPVFVNAEVWVREALIALGCGVILAIAAGRSQGMMRRALQAERSRANLARYFSPSMVDQLAGKDQPFDAAREQDIGVLFADMVGFTRIAERSSPSELIRLLRDFHARVAAVVFEHGGTLDKFIGDCVMATFGTPDSGRDDATRTVLCCRAIAASVDVWNAQRSAAGLAPVRIGIGAHYGRVVIGDIGDERRLEFAVIGDTVNVASRLEALTRTLDCTILISDDLVRAAGSEASVPDDLLRNFQPVEPHRVRNREEPVALWSSPVRRDMPAPPPAGLGGLL